MHLHAERARMRRRQRQVWRAMLRALAQPLFLSRQKGRQAAGAVLDRLHRSVESLQRELAVAAARLARRLGNRGVREARRAAAQRAAGRLRVSSSDTSRWFHRFIDSCRRCAARLCPLWTSAEAMADRTGSQLAYRMLRTLEKELWLLQSNIPSPCRFSLV